MLNLMIRPITLVVAKDDKEANEILNKAEGYDE
jgi:hypothetical protein